MISYRSEDEEDLEEDDEGSSVEEEEEDVEVGESSAVDHTTGQTHELIPAYNAPSKGSGIEVGSNGYAVSPF